MSVSGGQLLMMHSSQLIMLCAKAVLNDYRAMPFAVRRKPEPHQSAASKPLGGGVVPEARKNSTVPEARKNSTVPEARKNST